MAKIMKTTKTLADIAREDGYADAVNGNSPSVPRGRAKAAAYRRGYRAGVTRIEENLAGVHGRGPQDDAKRRAATLDSRRAPSDTERKLGRAVLQAQAALQAIDRNMAALANQVTIHVDDPLRSVPGTQRLAGNLALELRELLLELGMGVDTDGDPDPFDQVGR